MICSDAQTVRWANLPKEIPAGRAGILRPNLPEVTCGCCLETCPTQSKVRYGKSTSRSWPFQQDFRAFEAVTARRPKLTLVCTSGAAGFDGTR